MLNYQIAGKGNPLVLVHAWPLSSKMWNHQLNALKDNAMVIAPDIAGLGKSSRMQNPSIAVVAQWVAEVLDHLRIKEPVFIGGLSIGGYVTFEFIRQFPDRVRGVGLFATRANADTPEVKERRVKNIEFLEAHSLEEFLPRVIPSLLGKTTIASQSDVVEKVKELIIENSPEGICDMLRAMAGRRDSTEFLSQISWPTLVVAGEEDGFVSVDESKAMHAKIPGAEFHVIPKTGHLLNLENPQAFEAIVADFLKRN